MWHMPVIPVLSRLRQEVYEFKANMGYLIRPCLKNNWNTKDCREDQQNKR
jgi:hypothetical protein